MNTQTVEDVLSLIRKQGDGSWLGKLYRHSPFQETPSDGIPITINYTDLFSLGLAMGTVDAPGKVIEDRVCKFTKHGRQFVLRMHEQIKVVDFDLVDYDPKKGLSYDGTDEIKNEMGERFEKKICTLLFSPYQVESEEAVWKTRQKALLSYITNGWRILDTDGDEIYFQSPTTELDPDVLWTVVKTPEVSLPSIPENIVTNQRDYESFLKELTELLKKYDFI